MQKKLNLLQIALITGLLVACTDPERGVESDLEFVNAQSVHAAMSCQYARHSQDDHHQSDASWFLFRSTDRVESFDEASQQSQIWEKDQNGLVSEMRVFHAEKLVLEVSNGDLLVSGHLPKWATVWSIVDPEDLSRRFNSIGTEMVHGVLVERFQAEMDGVDTQVEWLKSAAIPMVLKRTSERGTDTVRLIRCTSPAEGLVHPTSEQKLLDYRHIDFSDLGDMESDPQVQRIAKLLGHGHDHGEEDRH